MKARSLILLVCIISFAFIGQSADQTNSDTYCVKDFMDKCKQCTAQITSDQMDVITSYGLQRRYKLDTDFHCYDNVDDRQSRTTTPLTYDCQLGQRVKYCEVYDSFGRCSRCQCGYALQPTGSASAPHEKVCINSIELIENCDEYNTRGTCIRCKWNQDMDQNNPEADLFTLDSKQQKLDYGLFDGICYPNENNPETHKDGPSDSKLRLTSVNNCKVYDKNGKCQECHSRMWDYDLNSEWNVKISGSANTEKTFKKVHYDFWLSNGTTPSCVRYPAGFAGKPIHLNRIDTTGNNVLQTTSTCKNDRELITETGSLASNGAGTVHLCAEDKIVNCTKYKVELKFGNRDGSKILGIDTLGDNDWPLFPYYYAKTCEACSAGNVLLTSSNACQVRNKKQTDCSAYNDTYGCESCSAGSLIKNLTDGLFECKAYTAISNCAWHYFNTTGSTFAQSDVRCSKCKELYVLNKNDDKTCIWDANSYYQPEKPEYYEPGCAQKNSTVAVTNCNGVCNTDAGFVASPDYTGQRCACDQGANFFNRYICRKTGDGDSCSVWFDKQKRYCLKCSSDSYLAPWGECLSRNTGLTDNCFHRTSTGNCKVCIANFYLNKADGRCVNATSSTDDKKCLQKDGTQCIVCRTGYKLSGTTCTANFNVDKNTPMVQDVVGNLICPSGQELVWTASGMMECRVSIANCMIYDDTENNNPNMGCIECAKVQGKQYGVSSNGQQCQACGTDENIVQAYDGKWICAKRIDDCKYYTWLNGKVVCAECDTKKLAADMKTCDASCPSGQTEATTAKKVWNGYKSFDSKACYWNDGGANSQFESSAKPCSLYRTTWDGKTECILCDRTKIISSAITTGNFEVLVHVSASGKLKCMEFDRVADAGKFVTSFLTSRCTRLDKENPADTSEAAKGNCQKVDYANNITYVCDVEKKFVFAKDSSDNYKCVEENTEINTGLTAIKGCQAYSPDAKANQCCKCRETFTAYNSAWQVITSTSACNITSCRRNHPLSIAGIADCQRTAYSDDETSKKCLLCKPGYALKNDGLECKKIETIFNPIKPESFSCMEYSTTGVTSECTKCAWPLILKNKQCIWAKLNCIEYNNDGSCSTCAANYHLYTHPISGDTWCEPNPNGCSGVDGTVDSWRTRCSACHDGSNPHEQENNTYWQTAMRMQYHSKICVTGCDRVKKIFNAAKKTYDTACCSCVTSGFKQNGDKCVTCPKDCQTCDNNGVCLTCNSGFFYKDGRCQGCPSNCLNCTDANTCTVCNGAAGWYVNAGTCVQCLNTITNCVTYTTRTQTNQCVCGVCNIATSYEDAGTCRTRTAIPLCKTYETSRDNCSICQDNTNDRSVGPIRKTANGGCERYEDSNCWYFSNVFEGRCERCKITYYKNSSGVCVEGTHFELCEEFDHTDLTGKKCLRCKSGYGLNHNNTACISNGDADQVPNCWQYLQDGKTCAKCNNITSDTQQYKWWVKDTAALTDPAANGFFNLIEAVQDRSKKCQFLRNCWQAKQITVDDKTYYQCTSCIAKDAQDKWVARLALESNGKSNLTDATSDNVNPQCIRNSDDPDATTKTFTNFVPNCVKYDLKYQTDADTSLTISHTSTSSRACLQCISGYKAQFFKWRIGTTARTEGGNFCYNQKLFCRLKACLYYHRESTIETPICQYCDPDFDVNKKFSLNTYSKQCDQVGFTNDNHDGGGQPSLEDTKLSYTGKDGGINPNPNNGNPTVSGSITSIAFEAVLLVIFGVLAFIL